MNITMDELLIMIGLREVEKYQKQKQVEALQQQVQRLEASLEANTKDEEDGTS